MKNQFTCLALLLLIASGPATACTTFAWSQTVGAVNVDQSNPRYSGACALRATGVGYVQESQFFSEVFFSTRFYFFAEGLGDTPLLIAHADNAGTSLLYELSFDGSQITLDASAAGGSTLVVPASSKGWHYVEFVWRSGGAMSLWVDSDARLDAAGASGNSGTGTVESMRLGAPVGLGGFSSILVDDFYTSRSAIPIGRILRCDADGDGDVDQSDFAQIQNEFLTTFRSLGQADCNEDGLVNSGDLGVTVLRNGALNKALPAFVRNAALGILPGANALFISGFE